MLIEGFVVVRKMKWFGFDVLYSSRVLIGSFVVNMLYCVVSICLMVSDMLYYIVLFNLCIRINLESWSWVISGGVGLGILW